MYRNKYQMIIEISLFAALALILDIFTQPFKLGPWISLSFKMLPIFIVAFRWGVKAGMLSGLIWGLLQIVSGQASGGILTPLQAFIEYFIAFTMIGSAGLMKPFIIKSYNKNNKLLITLYILLGVMIGSAGRYFCHFIAGIIFWGQYAPKNISPIYYSAMINGISWLSETASCVVVLFLLQPLMMKFIKNKS